MRIGIFLFLIFTKDSDCTETYLFFSEYSVRSVRYSFFYFLFMEGPECKETLFIFFSVLSVRSVSFSSYFNFSQKSRNPRIIFIFFSEYSVLSVRYSFSFFLLTECTESTENFYIFFCDLCAFYEVFILF